MAQMWNQKEDSERAMGESYDVDLGQVHGLTEVDGALLMELMEDMLPSDLLDGDVDRLSHVIQSLEAEIGGDGGDMAVRMINGESVVGVSSEDGVILEDMLLDLDHYEGGSFGYWPEMSLNGT